MSYRFHVRRRRERGVALVLVLGLVALVAAWAMQSVREDWISLRRAENMTMAAKAMLASESGLELGRRVLKEDDGAVDSLDEPWAMPTPPFAVDDGEVAGRIVDANRFFNLDDLVDEHGAARPAQVRIARRLFARIGLDGALVDALVDWMDRDDVPYGPGGAEDVAYLGKPWRVKNAPLDRLSEVLLIQGFDREALRKLTSVAVAWPHAGLTPININTAVKDVLLSLADGIPEQDVDEMILRRKDQPWRSVSDWASEKPFATWAGHIPPDELGVVSDGFIVHAEARFGRVRWGEEMWMQRSGAGWKVLARRKSRPRLSPKQLERGA